MGPHNFYPRSFQFDDVGQFGSDKLRNLLEAGRLSLAKMGNRMIHRFLDVFPSADRRAESGNAAWVLVLGLIGAALTDAPIGVKAWQTKFRRSAPLVSRADKSIHNGQIEILTVRGTCYGTSVLYRSACS